MKAKINMAVACGGGIFTTTVVTDKIKEILKKESLIGNLQLATLV